MEYLKKRKSTIKYWGGFYLLTQEKSKMLSFQLKSFSDLHTEKLEFVVTKWSCMAC